MKRNIPINEIKVPEAYLKHAPRRDKIDAKIAGFQEKRRFEPLPVVDQDMNLLDGYASLCAARELGRESVYCVVEENPMATVVTARHQPDGKDYEWELPKRCCTPGYIRPGTAIAVATSRGIQRAVVQSMRQVPALEAKRFRTALGRWHEKTPEELEQEAKAKEGKGNA